MLLWYGLMSSGATSKAVAVAEPAVRFGGVLAALQEKGVWPQIPIAARASIHPIAAGRQMGQREGDRLERDEKH